MDVYNLPVYVSGTVEHRFTGQIELVPKLESCKLGIFPKLEAEMEVALKKMNANGKTNVEKM